MCPHLQHDSRGSSQSLYLLLLKLDWKGPTGVKRRKGNEERPPSGYAGNALTQSLEWKPAG